MLDSLRADFIFGWRQLNKRRVTSAVAILSLGLAIGACTAAFSIIDALFLRPLPIANPDRLYALSLGESARNFTYAEIRQMRAVQGQAELIAVSGPRIRSVGGPVHPTDLIGVAHSLPYFLGCAVAKETTNKLVTNTVITVICLIVPSFLVVHWLHQRQHILLRADR